MLLINSSYLFIPKLSLENLFFFKFNFNFFIFSANFSVNIVSLKVFKDLLIVAIITNLLFPINDSCNIFVKFDSCQGINSLFLAANILIHLCKVNKDLFIEPNSLFFILKLNVGFSFPAKSINIILLNNFFLFKFINSSPSFSI